ncbi:DoxX family protein [Emticicia agri]|uniref:DoxX family protein n=1 Tax=Emticicia agri TaxID=2492393 RepID=A0A4Q5M3P1_9BACT|nr:DoxX family protein [Emticicia agri]RYU96912.1 DoxX family protein [Emticicia agri]
MATFTRLEKFYAEAKGNKWFRGFTVFCRITLALGFIPSGWVKTIGERFTALSNNHPLGNYFEALHHTGFYYTFIGVSQLLIALLLIIPRTAILGALLYFPIILNICILTYATRFEGTRIVTLMLLANLYLLFWHYDRIKYILPFNQIKEANIETQKKSSTNKFPFIFFGCVILAIASVIIINIFLFDIRPGNSLIECTNGCAGSDKKACEEFCDCIHNQGKPLEKCLEKYHTAKKRKE